MGSEATVFIREEWQVFADILKTGVDPLLVSPKHLDLVVNGAFSGVRNLQRDAKLKVKDKSKAAAYVWKKLGLLGFVTALHAFKPKQFLHLVSSSLEFTTCPIATNLALDKHSIKLLRL